MYPRCLAHVVSGMCTVSSSTDANTANIFLCINVFFLHFGNFFSSGRGSFLVLSAPWHAGSPPGHHGASLGPGRGPWHVLWGFKVASPHGE